MPELEESTLEALFAADSPELLTRGRDFPEASDAPTTLIEISDAEHTEKWPSGLGLRIPPSGFDERLRSLPEPIKPEMRVQSQVSRSGFRLIYWLSREGRSCE